MAKTYTAAGSATAGQVYTASAHNVIVTDVNNFIVPPMCRATATAGSSVTHNTPIAFAGEDFDTDGMHDTVTNNSRLTIQTAGVYLITFGYGISYTGTITLEQTQILKNGVNIAYAIKRYSQTTNTANVITTTLSLAVNDYIEGSIFISGGSAFTVLSGSDAAGTFLSAVWVGRTS